MQKLKKNGGGGTQNRISENCKTITKDIFWVGQIRCYGKNLNELFDQPNNICSIFCSTRRRRKKRAEEIFEVIMAENFPKLVTETRTQIQEAQRTPSRMNTKKFSPSHVLFKLQKIKNQEKISKEDREQDNLTYRETRIRITSTWASLVTQWLRICLPMQGTRVRALVWEDPTCCRATGPVSHNC